MDMIDELDNLFAEVKDVKEGDFENLPDGEYLAKVENAEYKMSKSDKPMVQFTFRITDGEYADRVHNKFMMLCGKDEKTLRSNVIRYNTELKKYGINADSISDSFTKLFNTVGFSVKLTITTKDGFTNTSVEIL